MIRSPRRAAFTLIEMITVIAIIAILAGLVLAINGLVQKKSAMARADAEVRQLSSALESFKTDNGGYPQDANFTDLIDPRKDTIPETNGSGKYSNSSRFLYENLTGDANDNGVIDSPTETARSYAQGFFTPGRLGGIKDSNGKIAIVRYINDPFGNPYGYSTAGLKQEQTYRQGLATNPGTQRPPADQAKGYNSTFDLWSTAGDNTSNPAKWAKNW